MIPSLEAVRVLIVEDDPSVSLFLERALTEAGYEVECAREGHIGSRMACEGRYDLILLDVMLPGQSGLQICRAIRSAGHAMPVIFLSARGTLDDKVIGLDAGADDYLPKPFQVAELLARVRANLRRPGSGSLPLKAGPIQLDPSARTVTIGSREVFLSPTEFALLEHLMRNCGRTVTRGSIMQQVWKQSFYDDKVIDVYVSGLRKKLGEHGRLIQTDRGVGYRILSGSTKG